MSAGAVASGRGARVVRVLSVVLGVVLYGGLASTALFVVLLAVLALGPGPVDGLTLTVAVAFDVDAAPVALGDEPRATALRRATGALSLEGVSGEVLLLWAVPGVVAVLAFLAIVHQLRAVTRTVAVGTPFLPVNVRRIRTVGWLLIGLALVSTVLPPLLTNWAAQEYRVPGITWRSVLDVDLALVVAGLLLFALAEVFRAGAELHEAQRLTI